MSYFMELDHVTREFGGGAFSTKPPIRCSGRCLAHDR